MRSSADLSLDDLPVLVTSANVLVGYAARPPSSTSVLLPGSFNPVHAGHWELAAAAAKLLDRPIVFELSVANVDKPELSLDEVQRRIAPFVGRAGVWITRAPRFTHKAELFPGATFIVGADTALRLMQPRYYDDDEAKLLGALESLRGCRFLVAARADASGQLLTLADLSIPDAYRDLFTDIPAEVFRCDVSSAQLRLPKTDEC